MMRKNCDFSEARLCGKLCVNFYFVAAKDTSCTVKLW